MIFVDSNVLIDIFDRDVRWHDWSFAQVERLSQNEPLMVTPIIVAEVGPRFATLRAFIAALDRLLIAVEPLSNEAAFTSGQAFRRHRQDQDSNKSILADFLIGGQAAVAGAAVLTRDPKIYRRYFAHVPLIAPDESTA